MSGGGVSERLREPLLERRLAAQIELWPNSLMSAVGPRRSVSMRQHRTTLMDVVPRTRLSRSQPLLAGRRTIEHGVNLVEDTGYAPRRCVRTMTWKP